MSPTHGTLTSLDDFWLLLYCTLLWLEWRASWWSHCPEMLTEWLRSDRGWWSLATLFLETTGKPDESGNTTMRSESQLLFYGIVKQKHVEILIIYLNILQLEISLPGMNFWTWTIKIKWWTWHKLSSMFLLYNSVSWNWMSLFRGGWKKILTVKRFQLEGPDPVQVLFKIHELAWRSFLQV